MQVEGAEESEEEALRMKAVPFKTVAKPQQKHL